MRTELQLLWASAHPTRRITFPSPGCLPAALTKYLSGFHTLSHEAYEINEDYCGPRLCGRWSFLNIFHARSRRGPIRGRLQARRRCFTPVFPYAHCRRVPIATFAFPSAVSISYTVVGRDHTSCYTLAETLTRQLVPRQIKHLQCAELPKLR